MATVLVVFACDDGDANGSGESAGGTVTKGDDVEDTGGPTTPPPDACTAACAVEAMCLGRSDEGCASLCASDHEFFASERGTACAQGFEALLRCIGGLTCAEAQQFADGFEDSYPCELEEESFNESCVLHGEPPPAACVRHCSRTAECELGDVSECEAGCAAQLDFAAQISEGCNAAQVELVDCAAELECADLGAYYAGDETICGASVEAAAVACAM